VLDSDEQFTSYEAQDDYYINNIKSRDDWEFVEVYTDEGITGTDALNDSLIFKYISDIIASITALSCFEMSGINL
jgi:hypothetical protein